MTDSTERTIAELQTKLAFQEHSIEQLNQALANQQQQIEKLEFGLKFMVDRLKQIQPPQVASLSEETPPPHY